MTGLTSHIARATRVGLPIFVILAALSVVVLGTREGVVSALASLRWWGIAAALMLSALSALGEGFSLAVIEGKVRPSSIAHMTRAYLAGGFVAFMTPYSTGGGPAWTWAVSREGVPVGRGAGVVTAHSAVVTVFFGIMVIVAASLGPLVSRLPGAGVVAVAVPIGLIATVAVLTFAPDRAGRGIAGVLSAVARWTRWRKAQRAADRMPEEVARFAAMIVSIVHRPGALVAALLAVSVSRFSQMLAVPILLAAQGFRLTLTEAVVGAVVVWVISSITPTPGGEGVAQAAVVGVFGGLTTPAAAAATALVWRGAVHYPVFLLGGLLFARLMRRTDRDMTDGAGR